MKNAGFITRVHEGRKQWLTRYNPFTREVTFSDSPAEYGIYSRNVVDELTSLAPDIARKMQLEFESCETFARGRHTLATAAAMSKSSE